MTNNIPWSPEQFYGSCGFLGFETSQADLLPRRYPQHKWWQDWAPNMLILLLFPYAQVKNYFDTSVTTLDLNSLLRGRDLLQPRDSIPHSGTNAQRALVSAGISNKEKKKITAAFFQFQHLLDSLQTITETSFSHSKIKKNRERLDYKAVISNFCRFSRNEKSAEWGASAQHPVTILFPCV